MSFGRFCTFRAFRVFVAAHTGTDITPGDDAQGPEGLPGVAKGEEEGTLDGERGRLDARIAEGAGKERLGGGD